MYLINKGKFNGEILGYSYELVTNSTNVLIAKLLVVMHICSSIKYLIETLKIKTLIINKSNTTLPPSTLIFYLPRNLVDIVLDSILINNTKSHYCMHGRVLIIGLPKIKPGKKLYVEYLIKRKENSPSYRYFYTYAVIKVEKEVFISNKIKIYNLENKILT